MATWLQELAEALTNAVLLAYYLLSAEAMLVCYPMLSCTIAEEETGCKIVFGNHLLEGFWLPRMRVTGALST